MSGYSIVLKIRRLEQEISDLGFRWGNPKHGSWGNREYGDVIALFPKDDESLPVYSRDAELFVGTIEQLEVWLLGYKKAREYDMLVFGHKHDDARKRKEQNERNRQLLRKIKAAGQEEEVEVMQ